MSEAAFVAWQFGGALGVLVVVGWLFWWIGGPAEESIEALAPLEPEPPRWSTDAIVYHRGALDVRIENCHLAAPGFTIRRRPFDWSRFPDL